MRMWMVNPKLLCRQHLLGEHKEIHMLTGCYKMNKNLRRYLEYKQIEPASIQKRHKELVEEMTARGYNHKSPLYEEHLWKPNISDVEANLLDLCNRCERCKKNIDNAKE
jgi:hypothetical protein